MSATSSVHAKRNVQNGGNVYRLGQYKLYGGKIGVIDYAADSGKALLQAMLTDLRTMFRNGHLPFSYSVPLGYEADHVVWVMEAEIIKPLDAPVDPNNLFYRTPIIAGLLTSNASPHLRRQLRTDRTQILKKCS